MLCGMTLAFAEDGSGNVFRGLVTFAPLMIAYFALKDQISSTQPFARDRTFMEWSRIPGFGEFPGESCGRPSKRPRPDHPTARRGDL